MISAGSAKVNCENVRTVRVFVALADPVTFARLRASRRDTAVAQARGEEVVNGKLLRTRGRYCHDVRAVFCHDILHVFSLRDCDLIKNKLSMIDPL